MASALFGGAALGAAFGEVLGALREVKHNATNFKSILGRFETTLKLIEPIIREIEKLDRELKHPAEETERFTDQLLEAAELVRKCSKMNFFVAPFYWTKLQESYDSVVEFFQIYVQAVQTMNIKIDQVKLNEILDEMRKSGRVCGPNPFEGLRGAPGVPAFTVGLDVPLQELKMKLLKDGVRAVVLSAPGGCGKTTLAKKLCRDVDIQVTLIQGSRIFSSSCYFYF